MSKSAEMKSIRRNIWISAGIIGIIQYSSIMSSILIKTSGRFNCFTIYDWVWHWYYCLLSTQSCLFMSNCQHIFSPSLWAVIKAKHTATTRRFECPNCHETHCIEVPKHIQTKKLSTSQV